MKTNFEKIKEMSIKELVIFFNEYMDCGSCPAEMDRCTYSCMSCRKHLKKWLESECEE